MKFLIYGATKGRGSGLGRLVAGALLERRHEVWGLCRDPKKAAEEKDFPLESVALGTEAGRARIKAMIRDVDPDVVWSACGCGHGEPLWALPEAALEEMIEANVRQSMLLCQTCAPSCLDGGPHLVLTGSVAGVLDGEGAAAYAGTKGFLVPFVRAQLREYARQNHRAKISLLLLHSVERTGVEVVADALEFIGKQSRALELLIN